MQNRCGDYVLPTRNLEVEQVIKNYFENEVVHVVTNLCNLAGIDGAQIITKVTKDSAFTWFKNLKNGDVKLTWRYLYNCLLLIINMLSALNNILIHLLLVTN